MEENTKTYCENASGTNKTTDKKDYQIKLNKKTRASYNHRNATLYISNGKSFRNITGRELYKIFRVGNSYILLYFHKTFRKVLFNYITGKALVINYRTEDTFEIISPNIIRIGNRDAKNYSTFTYDLKKEVVIGSTVKLF